MKCLKLVSNKYGIDLKLSLNEIKMDKYFQTLNFL